MTRCFYIMSVLLLLAACSINTPVRYIGTAWGDSLLFPFHVKSVAIAHELFPLHYSAKLDTTGKVGELSYSFIRHNGDSTLWEEGTIRFP